MNYYILVSDLTIGQWYLGDIYINGDVLDEPWIFTEGTDVDEKELHNVAVELFKEGIEQDYNETSADGIPIISNAVAECLEEFRDEIQLVPTTIEGAHTDYSILIVKNSIDCIDEKESEIEFFEEGNEIRPDLVGDYRMINILKLKTEQINKSIFRLKKFELWIIVNEKVKKKLEMANLTGIKFVLI